MPGRNANLKKLINYESQKNVYCLCIQEQYKKFKTAENDPNISNTLRISDLIQSNIGSKTRFGNAYLLNRPTPLIDSLGSIEGQPGGSFKPLRNRF
jgi:hypothetical protein